MKHYMTLSPALKLTLILTAALPASLSAQSTTLSQVVAQNTYVSSGQPTTSFNGFGGMEIAVPTTAQPRTEETLIQFNTAALQSDFNADYGAGNWAVTAVTLTLFSNFATAGQQPGNSSFNQIAAGNFELDWLSDNNWSASAITWNTLPTVLPGTGNNTLDSLGDFNYLASGTSPNTWTLGLDPNLVSEIGSGGLVSIFGQPTAGSTVGYLFNTLNNNPAVLNITVAEVPEPTTTALVVSGLAGLAAVRRRINQK
ncbi:MAG: PEP-CTERM sorting domain-containing protein [Verrucomicrobiota bacterium]|jgi:hypothetical protein